MLRTWLHWAKKTVGWHTDIGPLPFSMTVRSGRQAVGLIQSLASHHKEPAELIDVLVESLRGVSKSRVKAELKFIATLLKDLQDKLGAEAYALTTIAASFTIYVSLE